MQPVASDVKFSTMWLGRLLWPCASTPTADYHSLPFFFYLSFFPISSCPPTGCYYCLYLPMSSQQWFRLLVPVPNRQSQTCCHDCYFVPCKRRSSRHVEADKWACLSTIRLGGLCSPVRGLRDITFSFFLQVFEPKSH